MLNLEMKKKGRETKKSLKNRSATKKLKNFALKIKQIMSVFWKLKPKMTETSSVDVTQ